MVDRFLQLVYDQIPFSSFTHDQRKAWGCLSAAPGTADGRRRGWKRTRGLGRGHEGGEADGSRKRMPRNGAWRAHEKLVAPPTPEPSRVKGQPLVAGSFLFFLFLRRIRQRVPMRTGLLINRRIAAEEWRKIWREGGGVEERGHPRWRFFIRPMGGIN